MDTHEAILSRRTVRAFTEQAIPAPVLGQVLEACRWAPSWANTQCWEIVVITEPAVRAAVEAAIPEGNPAYRCIQSAPVVLALCARCGTSGFYRGAQSTQFGDWMLFDLGIASQNIALAAHAQGLGSVVLGLFDHQAARQALCVSEGYELVAFMPLGYPASVPDAPPRRAVAEFTHYNRW